MNTEGRGSGRMAVRRRGMALSEEAAGHLHGAFEQMDLLLATRQVDVALGHLLQLLKHLQTVRADTSC